MRIAPPEYLAARIQRLRTTLAAQQLDALLVSSPPNVAYLSGLFASSSALVLTTDAVLLLTDSRYRAALEARAEEWPEVRAIELEGGVSLDDGLVEVLAPLHRGRVGFEATHLTVRRHRHVVTALAARGWRASLVETDGLVEELRARKDSWEIARLRDGGDRLSSAAKYILSKPLAGLTESDVAAGIEARLRAVGFERPAFDTIVAAGPNAALPHGRAGSRRT